MTKIPDNVVELAAEAVADFLDDRFPNGAMPGGVQLFATDHLDAEFKHEAGCEALAHATLEAARYGELIEGLKQIRDFDDVPSYGHLLKEKARALLSSLGASHV